MFWDSGTSRSALGYITAGNKVEYRMDSDLADDIFEGILRNPQKPEGMCVEWGFLVRSMQDTLKGKKRRNLNSPAEFSKMYRALYADGLKIAERTGKAPATVCLTRTTPAYASGDRWFDRALTKTVREHELFHAKHIELVKGYGMPMEEAERRVIRALRKLPEGKPLLLAADISGWGFGLEGQEVLARVEEILRACPPPAQMTKQRAMVCGTRQRLLRDELGEANLRKRMKGIRGPAIKPDALTKLADRIRRDYGNSALNFYKQAILKGHR